MDKTLDSSSIELGFDSLDLASNKYLGLVAQLVERLPEEQSVAGSNPAEFTNQCSL